MTMKMKLLARELKNKELMVFKFNEKIIVTPSL